MLSSSNVNRQAKKCNSKINNSKPIEDNRVDDIVYPSNYTHHAQELDQLTDFTTCRSGLEGLPQLSPEVC